MMQNSSTRKNIDLSQINIIKVPTEDSDITEAVTEPVEVQNDKQVISELKLKDLKNYQYNPTDFIHGLLSSHVYQDSNENDQVLFTEDDPKAEKYNKYLKDWKVHKVFNDEEASSYYGAIYINDTTKQMILAHRGTKPEGNTLLQKIKNLLIRSESDLQADILGVFGKQIVSQQIVAYSATQEAVEYATKNNCHLSMTGHSLGAWLAEISAYYCHKDFNYTTVKVVNFDSPGSIAHMDNFKTNIRNHKTKFDMENIEIVTYLSAPNFVNSCNQHAGAVYRLFPKIDRIEALDSKLDELYKIPFIGDKLKDSEFLLNGILSLVGHKLTPLLDTFDPATGKPSKYMEVLDWPTIQYTPKQKIGKNIISNILNNIILDSRFIPNWISDGVKEAANTAIINYGPTNIIISLMSVFKELLEGNIKVNQYFTNHSYFDGRSNKEGYELIQLNSKDNFSLSYEAHYRLTDIDPYEDVLNMENKGGNDWLLAHLKRCSDKIIREKFDEITQDNLIWLKTQYRTKLESGKKIIISNKLNLELLRDYMKYLVEITKENEPALDELLNSIGGEYNEFPQLTDNLVSSPNFFVGRENVLDKINVKLIHK